MSKEGLRKRGCKFGRRTDGKCMRAPLTAAQKARRSQLAKARAMGERIKQKRAVSNELKVFRSLKKNVKKEKRSAARGIAKDLGL